jgi:hypothetical protein
MFVFQYFHTVLVCIASIGLYCHGFALACIGINQKYALVCIEAINPSTVQNTVMKYRHNTDLQYRLNSYPAQRERVGLYWRSDTDRCKHPAPVMQGARGLRGRAGCQCGAWAQPLKSCPHRIPLPVEGSGCVFRFATQYRNVKDG